MKKSFGQARLNILKFRSAETLIMTTEREYQEWKKKRQKSSYKSRSYNPIFLCLLGLLALSALISIKAREPSYNLPTSSPESPSINGQQI